MAEGTDWSEYYYGLKDNANKINKILQSNKDKNFVKRILDPNSYPSLELPENGPGVYGSHLMSYVTTDDGAYVFPMIVQDQKTGELKKFEDYKEAFKYAQKMGEYIQFDDPKDAEFFGKNYKIVWDKGE